MEQLFSNRYEIQDMIGKGGMATVYRATDTHFDREVAIKVLPREFLHDHTFIDRFKQEAQTIARLGHPAIVSVYDFGEQDGQPFMVMAYMPGGSLAGLVKRGPLSLEQAQTTLERVAQALDAAHSRGIIHRDVKPANILYDGYDFAYLSDFGIVKLGEATAQLTGSGMVGTPAYMAPEMMHKGGLSRLVDIYALTVTLYQMLTGKQPYDADTPIGILMAHMNLPVPDIRNLYPNLPGSVQAVIEQGMAKDPADRYQSTGELATAFRDAIQDGSRTAAMPPTPVGAVPVMADAPTMDAISEPTAPGQPAPVARSARRSALPWMIGAAVVLAAGIISLLATLNGSKPETPAAAAATEIEEQSPTPTIIEPTPVPTDEPTPILPTPTEEPTAVLTPIELAVVGVHSNAEWQPYIQEFDGVPMALVPAGCFMMGSQTGFSDAQPVHEICFDKPFWIDLYEVTNKQYGSSGYWPGDNIPRDSVTALDAITYCRSHGRRLPTEIEWEYAARGPDNLVYPWGNVFDGRLANFCDVNCTFNWAEYAVDDGYENPAPVGSYPEGVSWVGVYDLSGNVYEWVSSLYWDYPYNPGDGREAGPDDPVERVWRGGSWSSTASGVQSSDRGRHDPVANINTRGFRCARDYDG